MYVIVQFAHKNVHYENGMETVLACKTARHWKDTG